MIVQEVMSAGVLTAREDDQVRSVVEKMVSRHCGAIPVVDDNQNLIGIVAIRDLILPLYPNCGDYIHDELHTNYFADMEQEYSSVLKMSVGEVMTRNPYTVSPEDPVLKAASFMGVKNIRRMPVTSKSGKLLGMVSIGDINRSLFMRYIHDLVPLKEAI